MNEVAEADLEDLWACASPEALQRTVDLARKALKAPAARVSSAEDGVARCLFDPESLFVSADLPPSADNSLGAPIRLSVSRDIGTLLVVDRAARNWSDADRDILGGLAAAFAREIELSYEASQLRRAEKTLEATNASLLAVADRIPGLVFERRKVDAARTKYTFFGASKTQLPAVRKMMVDDGAIDLRFVHRDDRDLVRAAILRSSLEETDLDLTFRVKDFDRSVRWLRSQSIVRRDADGQVFWDGLIFDISDLVAARDESEAARALRDKLLLDVNSEMRTPLQAIIGFTDFLKGERQPERIAAHARNIRFAAESLLTVISQLTAQAAGTLPETTEELPQFGMRSADLPAPYSAPTAPPRQSGARILLADDLDLNRKLITDMLSLEGHLVDSVADGAAALEAARRHRYDLVLMDMIMPGMDGLAATRAIRALPAPACNVPIVALTAHSLEEQLDGCIEAGMDATLTKPMSIDALHQAVSTWIRGRKAA